MFFPIVNYLIFNIEKRFVFNYILDDKSDSKNISEGLRDISAGTVDYTDGADARPFQGQSAMKSEARKSLVCR